MKKAGRILLMTTLSLAAVPLAQAQTPSPAPSPAKARSKAAHAAKPATEAPSCPRAKFKNDPVCFGENDPAALPVPSGGARGDDATLTTKTPSKPLKIDPNQGDNLNTHPNDGQSGLGVHF